MAALKDRVFISKGALVGMQRVCHVDHLNMGMWCVVPINLENLAEASRRITDCALDQGLEVGCDPKLENDDGVSILLPARMSDDAKERRLDIFEQALLVQEDDNGARTFIPFSETWQMTEVNGHPGYLRVTVSSGNISESSFADLHECVEKGFGKQNVNARFEERESGMIDVSISREDAMKFDPHTFVMDVDAMVPPL